MRPFPRPLIAIALLFGAMFARADAPHLRAPENGVTLRGGSFAVLDWSASPVPPGAEEWEAFLSIDGGDYYAFRITPHLDIERRTFTWLVPNVDTRSAKILMRTGDEKRETHFVMPGSFVIVHDPDADALLPGAFAPEGAEAAREGEADVVSWAQGNRAGTDVTVQYAPARKQTSLTGRAAVENFSEALAPRTLHASVACALVSHDLVAEPPRLVIQPRLHTTDLLLACRRRNI